MKKMMLMCVAALTAMSAMAQKQVVDDIPKEVAEKIPEKYRRSVQREIQSKARQQANEEMEKNFGIVQEPTGWTNNCGKSAWINIWTSGRSMLCAYDRNGRLVRVGNREDSEEWRWREARQKEIQEALWKDQAVVDAAVSNVVAKAEAAALARKQGAKKMSKTAKGKNVLMQNEQDSQPQLERLEELIPFEEAMALAKEGKGKGYFQLALRYANGQELPRDARKAYMLLCKAVSVDYAHAILVEGLCEEENLKAEALERDLYGRGRSVSLFKNDGLYVQKTLREYCGNNAWFAMDKFQDSLTNEVAFARVMRMYEKAKALGVLTATNQITALNKRLADFRQALADYDAKKLAEEKEKKHLRSEREKKRAESDKKRANSKKAHAIVGSEEQKRYRVTFKEMFGYEMGGEIARKAGDKYAYVTGRNWREGSLRTPYRNFTSITLGCFGDRLYSVELVSRYGVALGAIEQEAAAVVKDLEQRYGIEFGEKGFGNRRDHCLGLWREESYGWMFMVMVKEQEIRVIISDDDLEWELQENRRRTEAGSAVRK